MTFKQHSEADLTWREKRLSMSDVLSSIIVSAVLLVSVAVSTA